MKKYIIYMSSSAAHLVRYIQNMPGGLDNLKIFFRYLCYKEERIV